MEFLIFLLFKLPIVFLITLLPKLPDALLVCFAIAQLRSAVHRKALSSYHYWYLGMTGYGFVLPWVSGWLWDGVNVLWLICMLGSVTSLFLDARKASQEIKALQHELRMLNEARKQWERGAREYAELQTLLDDLRSRAGGLEPLPVFREGETL